VSESQIVRVHKILRNCLITSLVSWIGRCFVQYLDPSLSIPTTSCSEIEKEEGVGVFSGEGSTVGAV
jgi:hypothetical protein